MSKKGIKEIMQTMTFHEKLEYLWEYYKWVLAVLAGVILIICTVVAAMISLNTETILAGGIVNVPVSPDGYVYLQEGYYEHARTEGERQQVELTNMNFVNPYTSVDQTYAMDIMENVAAMIGADVLDYLIYDETALPFFMTPELFTEVIGQAAKSVHRRLKQVEYRTQAPDHPILWSSEESYYLKFYIFQVCEDA